MFSIINKSILLLILLGLLSLTLWDKKSHKALNQLGYALIPSKSFNFKDTVAHVDYFYILKHEVTNKEYRTFIQELKNNHDTHKLKIAQVDTAIWGLNQFDDMYTSHYFQNKAWDNHPVVNISKEAAQTYVEYLNIKHQNLLKELGMQFRLPKALEWHSAAIGHKMDYKYSWGSNDLKDEKCNYYAKFNHTLNAENIHYNDSTGKYELLVHSDFYLSESDNIEPKTHTLGIPDHYEDYPSNDHGLYHMCGNVAEMLHDQDSVIGGSYLNTGYDIRIYSLRKNNAPARDIGFRPVLVLKTSI